MPKKEFSSIYGNIELKTGFGGSKITFRRTATVTTDGYGVPDELQFTPAELRLVREIASGQELRDAARKLGITEGQAKHNLNSAVRRNSTLNRARRINKNTLPFLVQNISLLTQEVIDFIED
jgi:DNA-binding CsgD family transcriptional regulator